ncbi:hypothetical protein HS088_TW22G00105 [Tripterygium wilfordii]|uniref:Uncharacterized protein n=1 Tax=Tripterygium wilfordii TaxID=458696 RepID=A0A7J7BXS9_TRIWF|nr:hypothetical protein HS088_TW22G00105 [Tripterygium wilfordii]
MHLSVMARLCVVCLILAEILVVQVLSNSSHGWVVDPCEAVARVDNQIAPTSGAESSSVYGAAEGPDIRRLGKHHAPDKSIAGGEVIIAGFVTAIFAAVFAYIRVTTNRTVTNK